LRSTSSRAKRCPTPSRSATTAEQLEARLQTGADALGLLQAHLRERVWLVGEQPTIADLSVWAYVHLAAGAGFDLHDWPAVAGWSTRVGELPGLVDDIVPYPENARPGAGASIYD